MTPVAFLLGLLGLTVLTFLVRGPIGALLRALALLGQFILSWLLAAGCLVLAAYCLSGDHTMPIVRLVGFAALAWGLFSLAIGVSLFRRNTPDMQDTHQGARFATLRELRRRGLTRKHLDV